jgi:hypothetical protein
MWRSKAIGVSLCLVAALSLAACGGSTNSSQVTGNETASVFTVGTDAPLPAVISCQIMVSGVTLNGTGPNGNAISASVLNGAQVVDFAKLSGLHQLIDLSAVPVGTYTSASVMLSSATIGYIDTTHSPPIVNTMPGTFENQTNGVDTVNVTFANPFVLQSADVVGLRMEFDLAKSLQVTNGSITGQINPTMQMGLLNSTNAQVSIDDFHVGYVGSTGTGTFTVQGPLGRDWAVTTSSSTVFDDPNITMSDYTTTTILSISGTIDAVSHAIDATEINVISTNKFYLGGLFTSIQPVSGPATTADLYIREELPVVTNNLQAGQITALTLDNSEVYRIGNINLPLTTLLFNNSMLAAGQSVDIGGSYATNSSGVGSLVVHRVVLRRQGQQGSWNPNSTVIQTGNEGSFTINDQGTAGVLLPQPLTVMTTNFTAFSGLSGLSALTGSNPIPVRVVGFVLVNSATGKATLVASAVQELTS